jgi:hypothetical protein
VPTGLREDEGALDFNGQKGSETPLGLAFLTAPAPATAPASEGLLLETLGGGRLFEAIFRGDLVLGAALFALCRVGCAGGDDEAEGGFALGAALVFLARGGEEREEVALDSLATLILT